MFNQLSILEKINLKSQSQINKHTNDRLNIEEEPRKEKKEEKKKKKQKK